jgi:hypothetical protein
MHFLYLKMVKLALDGIVTVGSEYHCCESGIRCFFTPGSGSEIRDEKIRIRDIPDHISESMETIFCVKNFLNSLMQFRDLFDPADPGSF